MNIVWLDDKISDYSIFIAGMKEHGLNVYESDTVEACVDELIRLGENVELVIVDLRMPEKSGFVAIREIKKVNKELPICVLSSYLNVPKYEKNLNRLGNNISILDKVIPDPHRNEFKLFIEKIKKCASNQSSESVSGYLRKLRAKSAEPFAINYKDFIGLPSQVKNKFIQSAKKIAEDTINQAFAEGKTWILLCGNPKEIVLSANSDKEIPSAEQIHDIAISRDSAPYQYSSPSQVDDIWDGPCTGGAAQKGYPTVTIKLGKSNGNPVKTFHFDTGSACTFIDYRVLDDLNLIDRAELPIEGGRGRRSYFFYKAKVPVRVIDQVNNGYKQAILNARAIENWDNCPFAGFCPDQCKHRMANKRAVLCKNRSALVGRNLLHDNKMVITLNGKDGETTLPGVRTKPKL